MTVPIRDAYGEALKKYGELYQEVVVLDADVSASTKSAIFAESFPERFFNVGIAESNMVAMAAGFAADGKIPFVNTFAVFLSTLGLISARAFGSYSNLNIKMMGGYGGLSDAFDGPSHHALEDIAIFRSLPNFEVLVASDEYITDWLVKYAITKKAPMFIRLSREALPRVYHEKTVFTPGKASILRQGKDVSLLACGVTVGKALEAAEILETKGISAEVIDVFQIKPLDKESIFLSAKKTKAVLTVEEHSVIGGLGGAVAEALTELDLFIPQTIMGVRDTHTECGSYLELLAKYEIDEMAIVTRTEQLLKRKQ